MIEDCGKHLDGPLDPPDYTGRACYRGCPEDRPTVQDPYSGAWYCVEHRPPSDAAKDAIEDCIEQDMSRETL